MKTIAQLLEIHQILIQIQSYARTELAKQSLLDDRFIPESQLAQYGAQVKEVFRYLIQYGMLPILHSQILIPYYELIEKKGVLNVEQLASIIREINSVQTIKSLIKKYASSFPLLHQLAQSWHDLLSVIKPFEALITPQLTIDSRASEVLATIRKRLASIDQQLLQKIQEMTSKYQSYLSEPSYTLRNGHYVLPVVTQHKNAFPGIFHDVSSTGLTTFIEPLEVSQKANEKTLLIQAEQDEVYRLLTEWTALLEPHSPLLIFNHQSLAFLDSLQAKAYYGKVHDGYVADLSLSPRIDLPLARHPLIDPKKVIANTFTLTKEKSIVIISGPNAGGKTVALKTVGLMVYMHQLGIPLLTHEPAQLSYFKNIYADIGDSQSVFENLSTFAGHIQALVPLTDQVKPFDLVLIDELGTGTDPKEGEALAKSLLMHLQAKQAFVIVSSHFPGLKELALSQPKMINASMRFDQENLSPTYQFMLGVPGQSYGLIMAKRYGLAPQVVSFAQKYIDDDKNSSQISVEKIQAQMLEVQILKQDLETMKQNLVSEKRLLLSKQAEYQMKLKKLIDERDSQKQLLLQETLDKIDVVLKALLNPNLKPHEVIALKQTLLAEEPSLEDQGESEPILVGDYVQEIQSGLSGKVTAIKKHKITLLTSEGLTVQTEINSVMKTHAPQTIKSIQPSIIQAKPVGASLNIIGFHVDEATSALDHYFDRVLMSGLKQVRVIHGYGTGALKNLVASFLIGKKYVDRVQLGDGEQSGYGVTTVYLK
jgi:DNA mismatch repair protein MutS2